MRRKSKTAAYREKLCKADDETNMKIFFFCINFIKKKCFNAIINRLMMYQSCNSLPIIFYEIN